MTLGHIALIFLAICVALAILAGVGLLVGRFSRGVREALDTQDEDRI